MFTYAAVFAQALRLGVPCYVNKAFFERVRPERTYEYEYELDIFDNGLITPAESAYHLPVYLGFPSVAAARLWHNRVTPLLPGTGDPVFMEESFSYDMRLREVRPGTTVLGNFQSWRYVDDRAGELRSDESVNQTVGLVLDYARRFSLARATSLHVRRGDYMRPEQQKIQGLATRGYYQRSLSYLRRVGLDGPVYLATDSPDVVREEFKGMGEFLPIDPPPDSHPFEVVLLLSRADGLVIANSSFSWWAGYIGERPGRVVIAPRPWFTQKNIDTRDLLPPDWLTLDRNG